MNREPLILFAALLLLTGVGAGAFGAHALQAIVAPEMLKTWNTAVLYQLVHGLGMLITVQLYITFRHRLLRLAGYFMLVGVLLFSGSLYLLVLAGPRWFGFITPIGGVLFLISWALVGVGAWSAQSPEKK